MPHGDRPQITPAAPPIEAAGKLIKQPGDGSCLYHSLICGECRLGRRSCGVVNLREQLAAWVKRNGSTRFNGKSVEQWMQAELGSSMTVKDYAKRQSRGGWGGCIEILAFVISNKTTVWVWIPIGHGRYRRTTCFQVPDGQSEGRIDLVHTGVHYDFVQLNKAEIISQMRIRLKHSMMVSAHVTLVVSMCSWHARCRFARKGRRWGALGVG